jgi:hypothetical protein
MLLIEWMVVLVSVILLRARVEVGTQSLTCVMMNIYLHHTTWTPTYLTCVRFLSCQLTSYKAPDVDELIDEEEMAKMWKRTSMQMK